MDSIEDLYKESRFELILYYLKSKGILEISDLHEFDFQELIFVPGVSPALAEDARDLYKKLLIPNTDSSPSSLEIDFVSKLEDKNDVAEELFCREDEQSYIYKSFVSDVEIVKVYAGVPRRFPFIKWCHLHNKKYMHQLCADDFEAAKMLKGIGTDSAKNLRKVYDDFLVYGLAEPVQQNSHISSLPVSADTPIEDVFMKLSRGNTFCNYCHSIGIFVLSDLMDFPFDHKEVRGIGENVMERLQQAYLDTVMEYSLLSLGPSEFSDIPYINYGILLPQQELVNKGFRCIGDICMRGLTNNLFILVKDWLGKYRTPIVDIFVSEVFQLRETEQHCLTMRAKGQTLQQIADHIGISRERVRQIVSRTIKKLTPQISAISEAILYPDKQFFSYDELRQIFQEPIHAEIYRFIIKNINITNHIIYLDFADKFLKGPLTKQEYENLLRQIAEEEIGEGANFFDNLERIDALLNEMNISALDFEDFMNFLVKDGYHFYGDYVMRGYQSYAIVCADAVRKHFSYGIKLNSDDNNEDLILLRKIISRHYGGLKLPGNNRALTARMMTVLVQSGKAQYCHIDSVIYSMTLFDDIYDYMQNASQPSFHYSELFELYKGRLLSETNITNYYFLHGMLKYLFYEDFGFSDRDIVTKLGENKKNSDARLAELLISKQCPISKKEIKSAFPGISEFVISFSVNREDKLISWDYNMYNHIDNLDITNEDISILFSILVREVEAYNGYLSDILLYNVVKNEYSQFLQKNGMINEINLYYTVAYLFKKEFRFRRPHILSHNIEIEDLSTINIAKYLLECRRGLNYKEYLTLSSKFGWANATLYSIFSTLEKEFVRVSEDYYIPKESFMFDEMFLEAFKLVIQFILQESGYFAVFALFSFQQFPFCQFEWNSFLVESLIEEFDIGFKILSPQVKDRRYQRGIIVVESHPANSFEELVVYNMKEDNIVLLNEAEFYEYLKQKGFVYNTIPQDLYNCPGITYKNEMFRLTV